MLGYPDVNEPQSSTRSRDLVCEEFPIGQLEEH